MNDDNKILSVQNLHISFSQKGREIFTAVKNLSFDLDAGKVLAIVGESGSGKSLTALALMGLLPSSATVKGEIILHDLRLTSINDSREWQNIRGNKIGMIFQEPMSSLNPVMKIGRQLQETILAHKRINNATAKSEAIAWLKKVQIPFPEKTYSKYPHELSGGQKQRVMIAMAMCNHPALLLADEPTTALDVTVQEEVIKLMRELQKEEHTSMIFITHDLALASTIADDVLVMNKGEMIEYGFVNEIFHSPKQPYTKALIACKPMKEDKGSPLATVADFMNEGKQYHSNKQWENNITNEKILEVNNLRVWFPNTTNWIGNTTSYFKAVENVSFELKKGEVLGLVGESGCGKSTLSKSLMGLLPIKEGQIIYKGEDIANYNAKQRRKLSHEIQMIFQDPYSSLNPRLTIRELIMEPMKLHEIVPQQQLKNEALRLLNMVQLPRDAFNRYPHQFSGGQRQRISIARALSVKPKLLICDESVSALDVSVQAQILNLLKSFQQELDLSYLFISHDLSVVHYISDRVMVMQSGNIVEQGDADQVLLHPNHTYTQQLVSSMPEMK